MRADADADKVIELGAPLRLTGVHTWDSDESIDVVVYTEVAALQGKTIDGSGLMVAPGLVDLHVHFRDPGQTSKEDMRTGSAAAAAGGFTDVCLQPNTYPAADGEPLSSADPVGENLMKQGFMSVLDYLELYADSYRMQLPVDYTLAAAATIGRDGEKASRAAMWEPFLAGEAADNGHPVVALSDDGSAVSDSTLTEVLENAKIHGIFVMEHCEHHTGGVMNEGETSRKLGVEGVDASTELAIVERDIAASKRTGVHIHLQHVSTKASFDAIRKAKAEGVDVTCETAPHYFALSDKDVEKYGSMAKMNPPLRSEADRQATLAAIADGTVDAIATDHAPHTKDDKSKGLIDSANGIIGLETSYALCTTLLVDSGLITRKRLIELMSIQPAAMEGLSRPDISKLLTLNTTDVASSRRVLDLTTLDDEARQSLNLSLLAPQKEWTVDSSEFLSKARNTPFNGLKLHGRPIATILNARLLDAAGLLAKGSASWTD